MGNVEQVDTGRNSLEERSLNESGNNSESDVSSRIEFDFEKRLGTRVQGTGLRRLKRLTKVIQI